MPLSKINIYRMIAISMLGLSVNLQTFAAMIPDNNSDFYYKIGGGQDVPLPAFYDTTYYPIQVEGEIGLGFNCGAFNPTMSLKNALNQIKSSFIAVENQVLSSAKAAIAELPLYIISRADPSLYNLLTNAIAGVQKNIALATQSCEMMQSQIAAGQNPYAHWMTVSMGNTWRKEIGTAGLSGAGDITQASMAVGQDNGQSGVPWVASSGSQLNNLSGGTIYAGGANQAPIHVIHDAVIAGYNVIVQGAGAGGHSDLTATWATASHAADWIVHIVGEQTVTTYEGGNKSSTPGVGLYTEMDSEAQKILPKLQQLVSGNLEANLANLSGVSNASITVSKEMIEAMHSESPVMQAIVIDKLSQNIAALNVIDKARLAVRLLQTGADIPAIYSNPAAQKTIHAAKQKLENDVTDLMLFINAKSQLAAHFMDSIMEKKAEETRASTVISVPHPQDSLLQNGAVAVSNSN